MSASQRDVLMNNGHIGLELDGHRATFAFVQIMTMNGVPFAILQRLNSTGPRLIARRYLVNAQSETADPELEAVVQAIDNPELEASVLAAYQLKLQAA